MRSCSTKYGLIILSNRRAIRDNTGDRAVSQFFDAFENNSNFGQKVLTGTDFRSKFVKMALYHNITVFRFSLVDIDSLSFLTMELYGRQLLKV